MKIQSLYFKNGKLGWEVKPIAFQNLNLLVGLSGAGKSQIIRALWYLRSIALGTKLLGHNVNVDIEWILNFQLVNMFMIGKGILRQDFTSKIIK